MLNSLKYRYKRSIFLLLLICNCGVNMIIETNKIDLLFVFASPFKNPSHLKHQKLLAPIGHKAEFMTLDDSLKNLKSNVKY